MTYRPEMERLSTAIAELLKDGATVPGDDIRAAVAGHAALVDLLRRVEHDLAIETPHTLEIQHQLKHQPRVTDQPLTDVLTAPAASRAGELWRDVARSAVIAKHEWENSLSASRPTGKHAHYELADIRALAEAVAVLNGDVADSLNAGARWMDAAEFRARQTPLLVAARTMATVVNAGPRVRPVPDLKSRTVDSVILCRTPNDLPDAFHRLARIIATTDVPPQHVDLIAGAISDASFSAAATLGTMQSPAHLPLIEHATRLAAVAGTSRRIATLRPGSGAALAQMSSILKILKNPPRHNEAQARAMARDIAIGVPDITVELAASAKRQAEADKWVVRQSGTERDWGFITGPDDQPAMLDRLHHAAVHAKTLKQEGRIRQGKRRGIVRSPREILAKPLAQLTPKSPLARHTITPRPPRSRG
jgi:hypothetical protein